jgi:hypothetical protein
MIPDLPPFFQMRWSSEDGDMTEEALLYMDNSSQTLDALVNSYNFNFNYGMRIPSKTSAEITELSSDAEEGTVWFNSDISKLQVKTGPATMETILSS